MFILIMDQDGKRHMVNISHIRGFDEVEGGTNVYYAKSMEQVEKGHFWQIPTSRIEALLRERDLVVDFDFRRKP